MALDATRDFTAAPDVTVGATVLTGTAPWQSQAYAGADEPGSPGNGPSCTRNVWHALKVPAAGTLVVHDVTGDGQDSVMSAYQAPFYPAMLGDCTFLGFDDDDAGDTKASLMLTFAAPCWVYVQHGLFADFGAGGGPDDPGPIEQMAWQFVPAGMEGILSPHELVEVTVLGARLALTGTAVLHPHELVEVVVQAAQLSARRLLHPHELVEVVVVRAGEVGPNTVLLHPGELADITAVSAALGGTLSTEVVSIQSPAVTAAGLVRVPSLVGTDPIILAPQLHGSVVTVRQPPVEDDLVQRTMATTVMSLPTPAIIDGMPMLPPYRAIAASSSSAIQGPGHIHAIADPDPVWNPATSGWSTPPPVSGVGDARWTVRTLPDPGAGYYWLGDPSASDGTRGIATGCQHWAPDRSTPGAPSWHSFFPYKPSVRAADSYLPGGTVVHHPKGVHFNSRFVEHMWLDFGSDRRQPFTVVMAAMIASYPGPGYIHYLLDAGRNPDSVGFPRISDSDTATPRAIADGLGYRQLIAATPSSLRMATDPSGVGTTVVTRHDASIRPKMFYAIFNGARSTIGVHDPSTHHSHTGAVSHPAVQHHRYFVIGRRQNRIAQGDASHMIIFEIRYWHRALAAAELDEQYGQLSSTYKFNQYRAL